MKWLLLSVSIVTFISSCKDREKVSNREVSQRQGIEDAVISAEASENVSIEDYWDEANLIRTEAEQIVQTSDNFNCNEAKKLASYSIAITEEAENTDDLEEAEKLIGKSNEALIHAEDALTFCQNKTDIVYSAKIQKEADR